MLGILGRIFDEENVRGEAERLERLEDELDARRERLGGRGVTAACQVHLDDWSAIGGDLFTTT